MIYKVKALFQNRVLKNAGWLIGGKIFQILINLVVGLMTARYLGPGNYGLVNYAAAYTAFFSSICSLGINSVIVKEFVDNPGKEGEILGTSFVMRLVSSALSVCAIVGISFVLDAGDSDTLAVVGLSSIGLVFQVFDLFNYWFQSRLQSKKTAIAALIAYTITAIYKLFLLIYGKSVMYFALATTVDYICVAIVLYWFYRREHGSKLEFSWEYGRQLLKKSCHYILAGLMVSVYAQTDKIMLKQMIDDAAIGYYATANSLCYMWCFILGAIIDSLLPPIMHANNTDKSNYQRLNRMLYAIVFYLCAAVAVLFTLLGEWAIQVLYGEAYLPAAIPLKILTWYTAFSYLGVARNAWVVCENKQKYLKYIYVSAAFANVVLNFLLIPIWGTAGAAIASLAAQIVTVMVAPFFIREMRENAIMMRDAILLRDLINRYAKSDNGEKK